MRISSRGHYGVQAMFELAMAYGEGPVSLKSIAEMQHLSENYLEQLFASLKRAGLVTSIRGAQGGYTLSRSPDEIKIGDIIRVLEGPIAPVDCVKDDQAKGCCTKSGTCITKNVWEKLKGSIEELLDSITLADMCKEVEQDCSCEQPDLKI